MVAVQSPVQCLAHYVLHRTNTVDKTTANLYKTRTLTSHTPSTYHARVRVQFPEPQRHMGVLTRYTNVNHMSHTPEQGIRLSAHRVPILLRPFVTKFKLVGAQLPAVRYCALHSLHCGHARM